MGVTRPDAPLFFTAADMSEPRRVDVAGLQLTVFSSPAPGREGPNQDGAAILPFGDDAVVLAVADGVGGGPGGDRASALALETLAEAVEAGRQRGGSLREAVLDGVEAAGEKVIGIGTGAATTLLVAQYEKGSVRTFNVGDSEGFLVGQRGRLKLQTISQSPSGYGLEAGLLTERQAIEHEERHIVLNLVGSPDMRIVIGSDVRFAARDTLVLGSDGLFDNWTLDRIVDSVRCGPLVATTAALTATIRQRMNSPDAVPSKPDDLTFIVARREIPAQGRRNSRG